MKSKSFCLLVVLISLLMAGCTKSQRGYSNHQPAADTALTSSVNNPGGTGRFTNMPLTSPPDEELAARGSAIFYSKCLFCHKLTGEKLIGPGWKGETGRRSPEWIMNCITITWLTYDKEMLTKHEMEPCTVHMPNQHLKDDEARAILEFMRSNDSKS